MGIAADIPHTGKLVLLLATCCTLTAGAVREICDWGTFQGSCSKNEVIMMTSSRYGRMQLGQCLTRGFGELGCHTDALLVMDQLCSGRNTCQVDVNRGNKQLSDGNPCDKDLASYLEVDHACVRVTAGSSGQCGREPHFKVSGIHGVLSSHVTDETGCGDLDTPWVIEASPGQRVNVSLVDFGWTTLDSGELQPSTQCDLYGYISERRLGMNRTLCGGRARGRHVYYSASNDVAIQVVPSSRQNDRANFLLQYEVIGCPDVKPPEHAWYKRNGSTAVIGCEWSEHSWHLKCEGNTWVGVVGNCSAAAEVPSHSENKEFRLSPLISVSLIIGLAVLVTVLLCVLVIGYVCCRRNASKRDRERSVGVPFPPNYEGQAFLYHPGRPVPLQGQHTLQGQPPPQWIGGTQAQDKPTTADELLHIWETPLPDPGCNPQDDSGYNASQGTYATLPCRGTMAGPCPPQDSERRVAAIDGGKPNEGTWPGTRAFFDQEKGWVTVPQ